VLELPISGECASEVITETYDPVYEQGQKWIFKVISCNVEGQPGDVSSFTLILEGNKFIISE